MGQSNDLGVRADIAEMYRYYFHRVDLEKRGICKYDREEPDERDQWALLTILLLEDINEFGKRFIKNRSEKDL